MKRVMRALTNTVLIVLGVFAAGFGVEGFFFFGAFFHGGGTGGVVLRAAGLVFPLSILILLINIPFIALGYRQIGLQFAIKSALAIAGLSLCLAFVKYPDVTPDKLLTAVFGGFFI